MVLFSVIIAQKVGNVIKLKGLITDAETTVAFVFYALGVITLIEAFQAENPRLAREYDRLIEALQLSITNTLNKPTF